MWRGVVSGAVVIALVGPIDDRWDLDALTKFAGQVLAARRDGAAGRAAALAADRRAACIVLDPSSRGTLLTVLVVVVIVNAINFVDGLDGLAAGIGAISAAAFFVFAYVLSVIDQFDRALPAALVTAVLVGVCLGFLPHNFSPARIFMGDTGSMLIGLLFAAAVVISLTGQVDPTTSPASASSPCCSRCCCPWRSGGALHRPAAGRRPPYPRPALAVRPGQAAPAPPPARDGPLASGAPSCCMYAGSAVIAFGGLVLALSDGWWVWPLVLGCVLALTVAVFGPRLRRGFVPGDARR